ncbi:MAG: hypothetical protein JXX28_00830 [Deltaproteobacteria bacterium]|nr:hypothetical protein [Deltaproteobacteria bacterium]
MLLALFTLAACTTCGDHTVGAAEYGERCGVSGSWGTDDGVAVWLFLEPLGDRNTSEDGAVSERPAFVLGMSEALLAEDSEVEGADLLALCLRDDPETGTLFAWRADTASVSVLHDSWRHLYTKRTTTSWRFTWEVSCADAAMRSSGDDVIELFAGGLAPSPYALYGTPPHTGEGR